MRALLAALLLLLARLPGGCGATDDVSEEPADDSDDDSDSAPFMIVVEHEVGADGAAAWRCSGALVSLRTGVTSADCARRRRPQTTRELWALAAAAAAGLATRTDGARRVSRVATAGARQQEAAHSGAWSGAVLDLAVLELEKPFGSGARARPILMATAPEECASNSVCHVVRALPRTGSKHMRLRIVDATLAADAACAQLVRYWAALRERALCLTGPELCQAEWGAGVVCGGKLCGVLSRSTAAPPRADNCGDTHAAHSVARWRRFLHCAHTLRACGRGSCAELCNEQQLLGDNESKEETEPETTTEASDASPEPAEGAGEEGAPPPQSSSPPPSPLDLAHLANPRDPPAPPATQQPPTRVLVSPATPYTSRPQPPSAAWFGRKPTRSTWGPVTRPPPPAPSDAPATSAQSAASGPVRPTPLFEPNRPDFRAGEYGDNAAEYGAPGEEGGGSSSSPAWVYAAGAAPRNVSAAARRKLPAVQSRKADRVFAPEKTSRSGAAPLAARLSVYMSAFVFRSVVLF